VTGPKAEALILPAPGGTTRTVVLREPAMLDTASTPSSSRFAYAAGHVVADPLVASAGAASVSAEVDWEGTLAARHALWDLGLGVAESMDTAQRGMGIDADTALELASRTLREAAGRDARVLVGIATDQLVEHTPTLTQVQNAYIAQLDRVEGEGGSVVMMASRHLARAAVGAEDYHSVYSAVLQRAERPVVLHWLGEAFDPELGTYWGSADLDVAMDTVVDLIHDHAARVAGIKLSLLDADREVELRRRLPDGVTMFTGDDFNYVELIAGDDEGHSHALLGAFAAVAPFASAALKRLDAGDDYGFRSILEPTQALSRLVFEAPTRYYKVGIAWLSYLTGQQSAFRMLGGFESGRSVAHLAALVERANEIGLFTDPALSASRANAWFRGIGV
jgi:hypothetical protein